MNERGSARRPLWHPQTQMSAVEDDRLTIVSGSGSHVVTDTGLALLDLPAGLWHANIGHSRREMAAVAAAQMRRLETYHLFGAMTNEPALELADLLSSLVPIPDASIILTSGGSDSVDVACKLARRYWQVAGQPERTVVLSREGCYHGLHGFGTSISGLDFNREGYGTPTLIPEVARVPRMDLAATRARIEEVGPETIAAIVVEPVIGTGGVHPPSDGYLAGIRELADEFGFLVIADEVITGFGRVGTWFASERWSLKPDIMTMAKGLTSGYLPLGAVAVAPFIADPFFDGPQAPVFRSGITYSGHATAAAVALENIRILTDEHLVARVAELEPVLHGVVTPLAELPAVEEVRTVGLLAGVQLRPDVDGRAVLEACRAHGVLTRFLAYDTLHISPPFVITADELAFAGDVIAGALAEYIPLTAELHGSHR